MTEEKLVPTEQSGKRIDDFLSKNFDLTRSQAKKYITKGLVTRNTASVRKAGEVIKEGEIITLHIPEEISAPSSTKPVTIIFENDEYVVVNKPAGIATHPDETYRHDTLVQRVLRHCRLSSIGLPNRPGVVHRIDKDTSGLLIFAKTNAAHLYFTGLFASRKIEKNYITLVHGTSLPDSGTIDSPIERDPKNRKKMSVSARKNAKHAVSHFQILQRFAHTSLLNVHIETGRTHQIRVHLSAIGSPIVGDPVYGNVKLDTILEKKYGKIPRLFLHAQSLKFIPPHKKKEQEFHAEIPPELNIFLESLSK